MKTYLSLLIGVIVLLFPVTLINAQSKTITVDYKYNDDRSIDFTYTKSKPGTYYLTFEFTKLENSSSSHIIQQKVQGASGTLFTLTPIDEQKGISFGYKFHYILGDPYARIDKEFPYCLPFKSGKSLKVMESSLINEKYFGAKKSKTWKSYSVRRLKQDTVCCMRKGTVIEIVDEHSPDLSVKKSYTSKRNRIVVEHNDGTYASYKGFEKGGIFVELGQVVYPQTDLGILSKFTEDYCLLHFAVYYLSDADEEFKEDVKMSDTQSRYHYLTPYFISDRGTLQLINTHNYSVVLNNEILTKEFTRREKKKYTKEPELFL
ncbi:hypothetical protein [Saccharicrinis aurantiacus]|uniref:hypothetical protein n=1 Tax=Saccharicrinis aurantiacus TaxID=1849719 RepID=UPI00094F50E8|nr:hypothetical protein [Saccharicrinis aurantiacus]